MHLSSAKTVIMTSNDYKFDENENLLCYHGPMIYEAKCLKRQKSKKEQPQYFIHYKGWNSKWEEWVGDDRVLALNAINLEKMASLKEMYSKKPKTKNSITLKKSETVSNTIPFSKKEYSRNVNVSLDLVQTVNVLPSTETHLKKRGRPSKILNSTKIGSPKASNVSKLDEVVPTVKVNKTFKIIKKNNTLKEIESNKINKSVDAITVGKGLVETGATEVNTKSVTFAMPAPVKKIIPTINIPLVLKKRIAYDYVMTTKYNKMLKFPTKFTVEKLIRAFICSNSLLQHKFRERSLAIGLTLMQYFNVLIHSQLLYNEEYAYGIKTKANIYLRKKIYMKQIKRFHFKKQFYPKKMWHYVYCPTYLLRLFVILPNLLSSFMYTDIQLALIVKHLEHFLRYVENNYDKYFTQNDYKTFI